MYGVAIGDRSSMLAVLTVELCGSTALCATSTMAIPSAPIARRSR